MFEALGYLWFGFEQTLTPFNLLMVSVGAFLGTWIGMLPGLGPAAGIALLLPVTFGMDPISAMIMLCGIYYGTMYGGSIASILINTPGDASSVMTTLDGYPMTKQGRGGVALFTSAIASFIGGTMAIVALTLVAAPMARFALRFGPPEQFAIMLLALIATATLIQGSLVKGLFSMVLGLMIATVGLDLQSGSPRFTFGVPELFDGVSLIAILIGVFAFSEALRNLETILVGEWTVHRKVGRLWMTMEDWTRSRWPIVRGAVIGFIIGVFPGVGAMVATLVSYSVEYRLSSRREEFGHGAIEGVAGPESANNASAPGALVPLLTLGIPGSAATAVLLGALMVYGIQPGPRLLTEHPELAWGVIASLYLGNIVLVILNIPLIGIFVRLLLIPAPILNALIMLLALTGAYSLGNRVFDIGVVIVFGILGYWLRRFGVPLAPLVLSVTLGGGLEQSLRQSLSLSNGDWLVFVERPISAILLAFALLVVCGPVLSSIYRSHAMRRADVQAVAPGQDTPYRN